MWLSLAFASAALLGLYDAAKKKALTGNAVLPVLLLNTFFCSLFFLPAILSAECGFGWFDGTVLESSCGTLRAHGLVVLKSAIVLTSWIFGYFGMKHLPLTIVGPINATRPVLVLLGALLIFGERLNASQWAGVLLALVSLFLLGRSSRREGVDFAHNRWILCIAAAALLWGGFTFFYFRRRTKTNASNGQQQENFITFGNLSLSLQEACFYNEQQEKLKLTPMQYTLMEMFYLSSSHLLFKSDICQSLWPGKDNADETLYTLIRCLKPIVEDNSNLRITTDRGRAYGLEIKT